MVIKLSVPSIGKQLELEGSTPDCVVEVMRSSSSGQAEQGVGGLVVTLANAHRVPDVGRYRIGEEHAQDRHEDRYRIRGDKWVLPHCHLSCASVSTCDIHERQLPQQVQEVASIVLLLESPHRYEYTYHDGGIDSVRAPACGPSGSNIDLCLGTVLSRVEEQELINVGSHVIISNPIQFQTSLYAVHRRPLSKDCWRDLRDNVWLTLWGEENIRQDFLNRLGRYNPGLIINACTQHLKPCVQSAIGAWANAMNRVVPLYEVEHPASWRNLSPKRVDMSND